MTLNDVLKVFPFTNGSRKEFIGEFTVYDVENEWEKDEMYQTIIILDRSGSMEDTVERMITNILPLFFSKLSYRQHNQIYLITFETSTELHVKVVADFPNLQISFGGWTYMEPAIQKCKEIFEHLDCDKPVRILTISDGDIQDKLESMVAADSLKVFLDDKPFLINSKAVRLFTSRSQPNTTALCSLLLINNASPKSLIDIAVTECDDYIATQMAELFLGDNFDQTKILSATDKVLRRKPWNLSASKLLFVPGINYVWMREMYADEFRLNGIPLKVAMQEPITPEHHTFLMESNSNLIVETMKIMKVVYSAESVRTFLKIKQYFDSNIGCYSALKVQLDNIYDDESVATMTSSQKASYLRK